MEQRIILSNCLFEAIKLKFKHPRGRIGFDFNSPSGGISFYFNLGADQYRFRRKIMRRGNKSAILFKGYLIKQSI